MNRIVSAFAIALAMTIVSCNRASTTTQPAPLRFTLDWHPEPEFGGFYAAQLNHSFLAQGLNIDLKPVGDNSEITRMVAEGKSEFGTTGADQVLTARAAGADVVAIFAVYQTCPQGVMVHKSRGFNSLADVFTHPGTLEADTGASWVTFCQNKFGINKDLKIITNGDGIANFLNEKNGPLDAKQCYITSEPILAANEHSDPQAFLIADSGFNPYTTVVITSGDMIRKNPGRVRAMIAACTAGWTAYLEDPAPANALMETLNKEMPPATFAAAAEAQKKLIKTEQTDAGSLGMMTIGRWEQLSRQMVELKVLTKEIPGKDCFVSLDQLK